MPTTTVQRTYRVLREDTQALLIDTQEKFVPHIDGMDALVSRASILVQGLNALGVPITVNEQYPQGLGNTVPELAKLLQDAPHFEKRAFSSVDDAPTWRHLAMQNRHHVLLFGIEAHVCVQQTALDLLDNGMQPILVVDAIGSRNAYDRKIAIRRMRRAGAVVTTTEAILFELLRSSSDPAFKTISQLVK
ncbi:hydrolase [Moraxella caviae]|uniref:Hydrolase n=1 Tax=Moraxella caviae TaxID=34060 RepID=A0A1T0A5I2_9GAMM|nr:hydrolase [Moraxella caviae]OOR90829.1 hydrolase [Moraxella caviae]STZ10659.1 Isochorismatase family [Moraxella caviae]VEW10566.1 Isochorismatase family [Moraxella caviae]